MNHPVSHVLAEASVVYFNIQAFASVTVAEQAELRGQLDAAVAAAVAEIDQEARIVLEAADGAAIIVLGAPMAALQAARAGRNTTTAPIGIGLNHGPVKTDERSATTIRMLGDGLETACVIADFSGPGRCLASRAFRDVLARQSPMAAGELLRVDAMVDADVRSHELYVDNPAAARARERRRGVLGVCVVLGLIGLGVGFRATRQAFEEMRRPAIVTLDVRPAGDIYLDGEYKGSAPAMTRLSVSAGAHVIEVRHGKFRPRKFEINVKPGEETQINHSFFASMPPKKDVIDRLKFWK